MKLQIVAQNPSLLGVGAPGENETEMGAEAGGPNPMIGPEGMPPEGEVPPEGEMPPEGEVPPEGVTPPEETAPEGGEELLPEPDKEDIKKYGLEIKSYAKEQDKEERDYSMER